MANTAVGAENEAARRIQYAWFYYVSRREQESMDNVSNMLYESRVNPDGTTIRVRIEYLKLKTAEDALVEYKKPGLSDNFESANINEDELKDAFIRGLALDKYMPEETRQIAKILIQIHEIKRPRYYA